MVGKGFKHSRMERLDDRENPQVTWIPVSFVLSSEPVSWQEVPWRVESMIVEQLNKLAGIFSETHITEESPLFELDGSDEDVLLRRGAAGQLP
jgi:hypothetical protein